MLGSMELALVRHGQTDWNLADRMQGSSDIPLNATGLEQAHAAAVWLRDDAWDAVVSSSKQRAIRTAEIIAADLGLPLLGRFASLDERGYGEAEGLTKAEADARFGPSWPGVETYEALQARAVPAVDRIAHDAGVEALVVVGHGTFIRAFVDSITGLTTVKPANGRSVRLIGEPGAWSVIAGLDVA